ncbi:hypothetical protein Bca101_068366 [Brassica carinata]
MENRRLSAIEKGKGRLEESYQAPRTARVRVALPDNSYLLQKHSLTILGRVTNPSVQKVWSLLPFFTEKWSTDTRPVGSDLGRGMFQFQFQNEADLTAVLEKRPYLFAKWMVIVQRWEPTTSPEFPSLILFWIKVQGIPLHLWTEETIKAIGQDIGNYEEADITTLQIRMRVHVNGRLPLIKTAIVEYPNGEEVTAHLVYEKLDKHCTYCCKLDHEQRDCLKAKADKREEQAKLLDRPPERSDRASSPQRSEAPVRQQSIHSNSASMRGPEKGIPSLHPYHDQRRGSRESEYRSYPRYHRNLNGRRSDDRGHQGQRYHPYHRQPRADYHRDRNDSDNPPPHTGAKHHGLSSEGYNKTSTKPREASYQKKPTQGTDHREESSSSKAARAEVSRDDMDRNAPTEIPQNLLNKARSELRDAMLQYTSCGDPTESAARRERFRQAEEQGDFDETARSMAKESSSIYYPKVRSTPLCFVPRETSTFGEKVHQPLPNFSNYSRSRYNPAVHRLILVFNHRVLPRTRVGGTANAAANPPEITMEGKNGSLTRKNQVGHISAEENASVSS